MRGLRLLLLSCGALLCLASGSPAQEEDLGLPWFAGPLFNPTATMSGKGAFWLQPYLYVGEGAAPGGISIRGPSTERTFNPQLLLGYGATDWLEFQLDTQAIWNVEDGASSVGVGDTGLEVHYLAVDENPQTWQPAVRLDYVQYFPTGSYDELQAKNAGTDARGTGAFTPVLLLNSTKTWALGGERFLRPHASFAYYLPLDTRVRGLNTYGGAPDTDGTVHVGNSIVTNLAVEYSITRHWALAFETTYTYVDGSRFTGFAGTDGRMPASVGSGWGYQLTIAPDIEYCIDVDQGIVAGAWVAVASHNTQEFVDFVITYVVTFDVGTPW